MSTVFTRRLLIGLVLCLAAACGSPSQGASVDRQSGLLVEPLAISTHDGRTYRFRVEVADNDATRERGLMFRKSLDPDAGMLFDFKSEQNVSFWMKNTLIPLDLLFIDKDGYIINLAAQATPMSEANIPSGGQVLGVLEIKGGRAAELGIEPGDRVKERIFGDAP
jgi:uncharacterized membrane protein (UPF0127 family)